MRGIKKLIGVGVLLTMPGLVYGLEDEIGGDSTKWRFKIFTAEHQSVSKGQNKTVKSIFKIDLESGKVWRYRQGMDDDGKLYEEFFEVPEQ